MRATSGSFLRDNAFLVAAVSLPLVVIGFFLLATTVPRWFVDPPAYDLVLRAGGSYDQAAPRVAVELAVRDARIEATFRAAAANTYPQRIALFVVDHETMNAREIFVEPPPDLVEDGPARTVVVEALADRRVLAQAASPDGYTFETGRGRGPGLVGELFGMRRSGQRTTLVKDGRVMAIDLPASYRFNAAVVGWIAEEGQR
jgi:hypothetical protein